MMMRETTRIWRLTFSPALGVHWLYMRDAAVEDVEAWIKIFKEDDAQGVIYKAGKRVPSLKGYGYEHARYVATM